MITESCCWVKSITGLPGQEPSSWPSFPQHWSAPPRHGGGGGGEEVVRQHGNYRQGQLHLQVQSFHSIHGHGR